MHVVVDRQTPGPHHHHVLIQINHGRVIAEDDCRQQLVRRDDGADDSDQTRRQADARVEQAWTNEEDVERRRKRERESR